MIVVADVMSVVVHKVHLTLSVTFVRYFPAAAVFGDPRNARHPRNTIVAVAMAIVRTMMMMVVATMISTSCYCYNHVQDFESE
jgi:hypothetical protein